MPLVLYGAGKVKVPRPGGTNDWICDVVYRARVNAPCFSIQPPGNELVVCPTTAVATSIRSEQHTAARRITVLVLTSIAFLLVGGSPKDGIIVRQSLSEDA